MMRSAHYISLLAAVFALGGCAQSTPSMMGDSRAELHREQVADQLAVKDVNDRILASVAYQYGRYGAGPMELTMTYDPKSKTKTAMASRHLLKGMETKLRQRGVSRIKTDLLPVSGEPQSLLISYEAVTAQAPSDCGPMPGVGGNKTSRDFDGYKFGCGVEALLAQQVHRPADLAGVGAMQPYDGRRTSNVVEVYRTGVRNEPLEGLEREDLAGSE